MKMTTTNLVFRAFADETRLRILNLLLEGEMCVCDLEALLEVRQAYLSQQLSVLREVGLVCYRRDGWNIHYRLAHPEVVDLLKDAESVQLSLGPCAVTPVASPEVASCCDVKPKA